METMLAVESVAKISELPIQRNSGVSRRTLTMLSSVGWCGMTVGGHASSSGGVLNALLIRKTSGRSIIRLTAPRAASITRPTTPF
ncbi:hypothetical protein [Bradyrhizobium japonicum]|uniref:hypothetical protein n=1 Tax=Bradyrhizobium japonicum TaxID=375 RepID=UPI0035117C33